MEIIDIILIVIWVTMALIAYKMFLPKKDTSDIEPRINYLISLISKQEKKIDMLYNHLDLEIRTTPESTKVVSAWSEFVDTSDSSSWTFSTEPVHLPKDFGKMKRISPITGKPTRKYKKRNAK